MTLPFIDRLALQTYQDDVQCEARLEPDPRDKVSTPMSRMVSERLLARLRHLGLACNLPLLSRLPSRGEVGYPEVQVASLEDELEFLSEVVSDPALRSVTDALSDLLREATHHPRGWCLVIECP